MKAAVVGDEIFMVAGEPPEFVECLQRIRRRILDRLGDAGGLQRQAKPQQVARIRQRDRIDPVALARLHGDEMLAFEPQQGLAHRLAAHGIALGEVLLTHIIAGRQAACQNIRSQAFIDIIAQKHRFSLAWFDSFAVL